MPRPRKLMEASVRMALERASVACTVKGATTLGEMWRTRMAPVLTPTDLAFWTYSRPLAEMTEARTVRANTGILTMPVGDHGVDQPAAQHGGDEDGQQDGGEGEKDVHDTHDDAVHPALKVAGYEAQHVARGGGDADGDDAHLKGDAGAVEDAAEDVAPVVIRTEPEFRVRGRFGEPHHFFRAEVGKLGGEDGHQNDEEDAQHADAPHGIAPELPYGLSKSFQGGSPQS